MRLTILCIILISVSSFGDGFRSFSDKNGRSITAKILKVNAGTNKVTLQKENKRTTTVSISIFCDDDQEYILSWTPQKSLSVKRDNSVNHTPATKERIRELLNTYVIKQRNISREWPLYIIFEHTTFEMKRVTLETKVDCGFEIEVTLSVDYPGETNGSFFEKTARGWILLTPDGQIKYDSFQAPHPIERLYVRMRELKSTYRHTGSFRDKSFSRELNRTIDLLKKYNIPSFGFTPNSNMSEAKDSIQKMAGWLLEHGSSFDISEPHVFFPEAAFERYERTIRKYK